MLGDANTTSEVRAAKEKHADRKATRSYLGQRFAACMKTAVTTTEKEACTDDMNAKITVTGETQSKGEVLKAYRAEQLAAAALVCSTSTTEKLACMESELQDMIDTGMKKRAFKMIRKIGTITATAEAYALCMTGKLLPNATDLETQCEGIAKENFLVVSGADEARWAKVKNKIIKVATAIQNGEEVVLRKKMSLLINAITGGTCNEALLQALSTLVQSLTTTPAISGYKLGSCEMVDGNAEYSGHVGVGNSTDDEIDTIADTVNTGIEGKDLKRRRLLLDEARRLATVDIVYTAQETEACAASDTACGTTDPELTGSGSGGATTAGTTEGTTEGTGLISAAPQWTGIRSVVILAMITSALMQ